jgi:sugar phosphate isomerase/epimerase
MKKVSIGSWAYIFGEYANNPIPLNTLCEELHKLGFDGISMGGFRPHAHPDDWGTPEKIAELKKMLADNKLEVADYAADMWSVNALKQRKEYVDIFTKNVDFCDKMGFKIIRVDSDAPPVLPEGMTYEQVKDFYVKLFKECAQIAAKKNLLVVWEFEPGFIINEPKNVAAVCKAVNEPNFKILLDTCHAYMGAVIGANHIEPGCTLKGGVAEYCELLKDMIGVVHVIDSDGSLNSQNTSTHAPFGIGKIDFDEVIPALLNKANYKGDWWAIDLCEWGDAWESTAMCKEFVDKQINEKYCK